MNGSNKTDINVILQLSGAHKFLVDVYTAQYSLVFGFTPRQNMNEYITGC